MDAEEKATSVRMKPETYALFNSLHQQLNAQLPFGAMLSKADLLDLCVSSTSALLAEGRLPAGRGHKGKGKTAA